MSWGVKNANWGVSSGFLTSGVGVQGSRRWDRNGFLGQPGYADPRPELSAIIAEHKAGAAASSMAKLRAAGSR
jgi:hypothetical protein